MSYVLPDDLLTRLGLILLDTATVDYDGVYDRERHMFRLAAMAEKPIPAHGEPSGLGLFANEPLQ